MFMYPYLELRKFKLLCLKMATYKPFNLSCLLQTHQNSVMEKRMFLHAVFDPFFVLSVNEFLKQ